MAGLLRTWLFWFAAPCGLVCRRHSGKAYRSYLQGMFSDFLPLHIELICRATTQKSESLNYMEEQAWNFATKLLTSRYQVIKYAFKLLTATHAEFLVGRWHLDRFLSDYFGSLMSVTLRQFSKLMFHSSTISGIWSAFSNWQRRSIKRLSFSLSLTHTHTHTHKSYVGFKSVALKLS
jgi:hypothetical protein